MELQDFTFGDHSLSDFGMMLGYVSTSAENNTPVSTTVTFDEYKNNLSWKSTALRSKYEENLSATFDIIRNSCNDGNIYIDNDTLAKVIRWLNSKTYQEFTPIYDSELDVHYYGTFPTIETIHLGNGIVGLTVTFQANAPYGFSSLKTVNTQSSDADWTLSIPNNMSDDIGFVYPQWTITPLESGDLTITPAYDGAESTTILDCVKGTAIEIACDIKTISTSMINNFNWIFPNIYFNEDAQSNFTVSLPCEITVTYQLIRKVGIYV